MSVISIAMSGVRAATARLDASADNLAHQFQRAPLAEAEAGPPAKPGASPAPKVYRPVRANLYSLASSTGQGVRVAYTQADPGFIAAYDPSAREANADGFVALPNVSPEAERLEQMQAASQYRMSLSLVAADDEMQKSALDVLA